MNKKYTLFIFQNITQSVKNKEISWSFPENTEEYKTFSVLIVKEVTNIDKYGNESVVIISYKMKFIDSARFMATSLSNLVDNLIDGIQKIKWKCEGQFDKIKKCVSWNKNHSNKIDEELENRFNNTLKLFNNDINKFILLLRKDVYPYERMDDWENFNETTLPEEEEFYSNLNMENITNANYAHVKRVCKDFKK